MTITELMHAASVNSRTLPHSTHGRAHLAGLGCHRADRTQGVDFSGRRVPILGERRKDWAWYFSGERFLCLGSRGCRDSGSPRPGFVVFQPQGLRLATKLGRKSTMGDK
ncbi:uncharacterized protein LOC131007790 [Salvia miltiorrhiza]|uniref:uncharacterized protein LOC131007790 n=1 Tax=Salvia miltiorrhiza TaxID=226208 RepID=UPI0025ABFF7E|nr:uncharacterized protein LOC131007790 [Salvia miltiorrhiza]